MSLATILGMTVVRAIPAQTIIGLLTGQYTLHGGVIRWAAGTTNAGQIVAHLVPASFSVQPTMMGAGLINSLTIPPVGAVTGLASTGLGAANLATSMQILQIARGVMQLSALNLVVTWAGFQLLHRRLDKFEATLQSVARTTTEIQTFLQREQRAELHQAIERLANNSLLDDPRRQADALARAEDTFSRLRHFYADSLATSKTIETAMAAEEYVVLTSLGAARCYAELGELRMAQHLLEELHASWQKQARRILKDLLIGEHRERFLHRGYVSVLPAASLVEILDFAYDKAKGIGWIDTLRRENVPLYDSKTTGNAWDRVMRGLGVIDEVSPREREIVAPAMRKLIARNQVLEGYISQYALLAEYGTPPGAFEDQIRPFIEQAARDEMVILLADDADQSWEAMLAGQDSDRASQPGKTRA